MEEKTKMLCEGISCVHGKYVCCMKCSDQDFCKYACDEMEEECQWKEAEYTWGK